MCIHQKQDPKPTQQLCQIAYFEKKKKSDKSITTSISNLLQIALKSINLSLSHIAHVRQKVCSQVAFYIKMIKQVHQMAETLIIL